MKVEDEKKTWKPIFLTHFVFEGFQLKDFQGFALLSIFLGCFHYEAILGFALWVMYDDFKGFFFHGTI